MITQEEVIKLFNYNPVTGILIRRTTESGNAKKNSIVGCKKDGYLVVRIKNILYRVHRIIWLYLYGYIPENIIDHKNRVRDDNRIENLREVSNSCNSINCKLQVNNRSSVKGVSFYSRRKAWSTEIVVSGKKIRIGYYKDFTEAVAGRLAAEQCLGWDDCDNRTTAFKYMENWKARSRGEKEPY